jgi:YafQ family addiction module toxin component
MFDFELKESLERKFRKISKKDKPLMIAINKKISEIVSNTPDTINRYKNLRHDLKKFKRVHIGHYVLSFKVDIKKNSIIFEDFEHHNNAY